jgi:hypothetical protein
MYCFVIDPRRTSEPAAYAGTMLHYALAQGQRVKAFSVDQSETLGGALRIAFASHVDTTLVGVAVY